MRQPNVPSVVRRLILALSAAIFGMVALTGAAAANEPSGWILPEDDRDVRIPALVPAPLAAPATPTPSASAPSAPAPPAPSPEPQRQAPAPSPATTPEATPRPTPPPTQTPRPEPSDEGVGFDISYPQCGNKYPDSFAFAIVGVNGGRVFDRNPCFGAGLYRSQLEWAGADAELYFNTGNPGPMESRHWPSGQSDPRTCEPDDARGDETDDGREDDTLDCAYVYGWNAAEFAHTAALEAYVDLGWLDPEADRLPDGAAIWLDVEEANSWRRDRELNVAMLEGAVAYLESVDVDRIGFYSTPRLWGRITGGTDRFSDHPAWHAGARDRADAERRCAEESAFTGGELLMVQWVEGGLDRNIRCEAIEPEPGS